MVEIKENFPLKQYNTFGINCLAKYFVSLEKISELKNVLFFADNKEIPFKILGGGSNILFTRDYPGIIVKMDTHGIEMAEENNEEVTLKVEAGENWDDLVKFCVRNGWGGIENLSLIPGCTGAAPIQNIGAYGVEIKDVLERVEYYHTEKSAFEKKNNGECEFGYRQSIFKDELKDKAIITSVFLKLKKNPVLTTNYGSIEEELLKKGERNIQNVREAVIRIRESKLPDPQFIGNAGSFFKNPVITSGKLDELKNKNSEIPFYPLSDGKIKVPAAWLIEKCGWKGHKRGNVGVHHSQPLVLVNFGNGSGNEILKLAEDIGNSIFSQFGIKLEKEVNILL